MTPNPAACLLLPQHLVPKPGKEPRTDRARGMSGRAHYGAAAPRHARSRYLLAVLSRRPCPGQLPFMAPAEAARWPNGWSSRDASLYRLLGPSSVHRLSLSRLGPWLTLTARRLPTSSRTPTPTVAYLSSANEGRVAAQTGPTWCVAIPGATTTTTDRNAHTDADTWRTVQSTTLANYRTAAEDQGGELESLRRLRNHARSTFKAILAYVERISTPLPAICKLVTHPENLVLEQACLTKLDSAIII